MIPSCVVCNDFHLLTIFFFWQTPKTSTTKQSTISMCRKPTTMNTTNNTNRTGSEWQFPGRLHDMMTYVEKEGLQSIISWVQGGRAFMIHNPDKLLDILPKFFSQTKYRSFRRQLNMWHFDRVLCGPDRGAFEHPFFVRGRKALCKNKSRQCFKVASPKKLHFGIQELLSNDNKHRNNSNQSLSTTTTTQTPEPTCAQHVLLGAEKVVSTSSLSSYTSTTSTTNTMLKTTNNINSCFFSDGDICAFEGRQFHFVDLPTLQI